MRRCSIRAATRRRCRSADFLRPTVTTDDNEQRRPLLREEVEPKRRTPLRRPNPELRTREHLTEAEVDKLIEAAKSNRSGQRDARMILVAYRHGLRASELVTLRWDQVSFSSASLHVRGQERQSRYPSPHRRSNCAPCAASKREQKPPSQFVFMSERGTVLDRGLRPDAAAAAKAAGLTIAMHPHMLRHACGYKLANDGQDTRAIQSLPRPQEHPAHGPLHRAGAESFQRFLARLNALESPVIAAIREIGTGARWSDGAGKFQQWQ